MGNLCQNSFNNTNMQLHVMKYWPGLKKMNNCNSCVCYSKKCSTLGLTNCNKNSRHIKHCLKLHRLRWKSRKRQITNCISLGSVCRN